MNCPRCKSPVGPLSTPDSIVTCPGCGSRLMTKAAARRSQGGPGQPAAAPAEPVTTTVAAATAAAAVVPAARAEPRTAPPPAPVATTPPLPPPNATLPPTPVVVGAVAFGRREPTPSPAVGYEPLLRELRAVREVQERILAMLELALASPVPRAVDGEEGTGLSPIRAPHRKSVVLIDDDPATREAATRELEQADVPVLAFADGNEALRGIAEEKPDVIVLELGLGGDMAGKDVINVIKATMEWVDIPIVLWTREPVANQKEARQIHGADEIVPKSGGAAALVARVITVFRRG
jgi:CheY-like chemotaxis protein/DNA-directed RNA polymerase subunit RPC12/RpoP